MVLHLVPSTVALQKDVQKKSLLTDLLASVAVFRMNLECGEYFEII